jgi:pimeloyl-ACP methyl ester carboxylesterase
VALVSVNNTRLNVQQLQQKSDLPPKDLILCHGLASTMAFWLRSYVNALSPHFRITLFDMRGHGRSHTPETGYKAEDLATDLNDLMDQLKIKSAHIIGHSFGGITALKLAVMFPERANSLVLLDSQIGLGRNKVSQMGWAEDQAFLNAMEALDIKGDVSNPFFGVELISQLTRIVRSGEITRSGEKRLDTVLESLPLSVSKKWEILEQTSDALVGFTTGDDITAQDLAGLSTPTLGIYGANSAARFSGEALENYMPNAKMALMANAGHFFATTRPKEVMEIVSNFWALDDIQHAPDVAREAV